MASAHRVVAKELLTASPVIILQEQIQINAIRYETNNRTKKEKSFKDSQQHIIPS